MKFLDGQRAVGQQTPGQVLLVELTTYLLVECFGKRRKVLFRQREACRHGVTTELADQMRMTGRHGIQRIANVKPRYRTGRTFEHALPALANAMVGRW